ncbi:MAG: WxL domain-containing protein ElrC, partial [Enterococcus faecalis]
MKKIILSTIPAITLGVAIAPEVNAEEKNYESNAIVEFTPDTSINKPVDPVNPDTEKPVEPFDPTTPDTGNKPNEGTTGPLSIDYASSLDFGKNKISNKDEKYYANPQYFFLADGSGPDLTNPKPNYVQISDKRGTNAGWALTVKQETQLTATKETLNKVLDGSEIKLSQNKAVSNSKAVTP